jgi:hypothetical protein
LETGHRQYIHRLTAADRTDGNRIFGISDWDFSTAPPATVIACSVAHAASPGGKIARLTGRPTSDCLKKLAGKKHAALKAWFAGLEGPQAVFAGRVLPFDEKAGAGLGATDGRRGGQRACGVRMT